MNIWSGATAHDDPAVAKLRKSGLVLEMEDGALVSVPAGLDKAAPDSAALSRRAKVRLGHERDRTK